MTIPSKASIRVATDALRAEGAVWSAQAGVLDTLAGKAEGLRLTRIEAGLFQVVFSAYEEAVTTVTDRAREGSRRMDEIAATLIQVANTYDQEEQANEHGLRNVY
ncbi:hypothetical protein UO65_4986 [Actinokineospora spheciospongiae]|uniref:Excreted virulence factor EspC (Type VII ESX diderm) n=1 Tax=Actinokineospora spheciospongiae TaxID=909613 RepID=W7ISN8_9PSEU|nr:hypothetical protein [Actinokineospora spheciospongiae]EWC59747.1 hypothetical protein UO65_4986 [Actinokineospora spheciospongiae]PWW64766.1 hypothetical protein DFQ13_103740 [Actinokineospora spheciospongiae]